MLDSNGPTPEREMLTTTGMPYYSRRDGLLFKSYVPGHLLRKRSTFRYQLVVPNAFIGLVLHAYHDHHALFAGHLVFRPTYDKIRQKHRWRTMHRDVHRWCQERRACSDGYRRRKQDGRYFVKYRPLESSYGIFTVFPGIAENRIPIFCFGISLYSTTSNNCICCLLYTSPSPRDRQKSRMPSSA